jgi:hypothetical protein
MELKMETNFSTIETSRKYSLILHTLNDLNDAAQYLREASKFFQDKSEAMHKLSLEIVELITKLNEVL